MNGRNRTPLEEKFDRLEENVKIEPTDIEAELISHAHDYWHATNGHADALSLRDLAKHDLDVYEARLDLNLRKVMAERGEKYTEAVISNMVTIDEERIKLFESYLDAKHVADLWAGMKDSWQQRGYMLKEIVEHRRGDNVAESSYARQRSEALNNYRRRD